MEPYYLAPVLATFAHALPQTFREIEVSEGVAMSLTVSGEAGGSWTVRREHGQWQLYTGKPEQPQAEVTLPQAWAWRLFTKGITEREAREVARFSGDKRLSEKMLETVAIIA